MGTARRLKTDKVVKIARLNGCKNFVGEREKFMRSFKHICRLLCSGGKCC